MFFRRFMPALLFLLTAPPALGAQLRSQEVRSALAGLRDSEPELVASEISAYGPGITRTLFMALDEGLPGDAGPVRLRLLERRVVLRSLGILGRDVVRPLITSELAKQQPDIAHATLVEVLGEIGQAYDLPQALRIATSAESKRSVAAELQTTCEHILRRDSRGYRVIRSLVPAAHRELRRAMISGTAATNTHAALSSLAGLLGFVPDLDADLLAHIAAVGESVSHPVDAEVRDEVRPYLWDPDPTIRREAIFAVAALRDEESIGRLIQLLGQSEGTLHEASHQALREITGLAFADITARWRIWFATEQSWYRDHAPQLTGSLDDADPGTVGKALNEIVQRTLFHRELAGEVERVLDRDEPALRRKACLTLARMGSARQVPRLVELLDDPEDAVALAAHTALIAITKRDLAASSEEWEEVAEAARRRRT